MISVNLDKAKEISHTLRRNYRAAAFAPHDAVIAKQIPGKAGAAAESARQLIRDHYALMQIEIDDADSCEALKVALSRPLTYTANNPQSSDDRQKA